MRASGILMPISALPGNAGIGTLGKCAFDFAEYARECGCTFWQVLPLHPTGFGDSPYQAFSTFAGNPYLIDLDDLVSLGLLERGEIPHFPKGRVDYGRQYREKFRLLRLAYGRSGFLDAEIQSFSDRHYMRWLRDYALFMCLKEDRGGSWRDWERPVRERWDPHMFIVSERYMFEERFWVFVQYLFFRQFGALKNHLARIGLKLIGDMPIYVAMDSADTWANREIFRFRGANPTAVAGVPPDYFSPEGQLWGNPLYRWDVLKKRGYDWWISRVSHLAEMYDVLRVDHFRGFESFWNVPAGAATAREGHWEKGPGEAFLRALPKVSYIAEDLGIITPEVRALREKMGWPGMNIMQFAFDANARDSLYLPHNHEKNSVSYLGTHDNDTFRGWLSALSESDRRYFSDYCGGTGREAALRALFSSPSELVIATMQDVLGLKKGRINTPAIASGNWTFRLSDDSYRREIGLLRRLNRTYSRG